MFAIVQNENTFCFTKWLFFNNFQMQISKNKTKTFMCKLLCLTSNLQTYPIEIEFLLNITIKLTLEQFDIESINNLLMKELAKLPCYWWRKTHKMKYANLWPIKCANINTFACLAVDKDGKLYFSFFFFWIKIQGNACIFKWKPCPMAWYISVKALIVISNNRLLLLAPHNQWQSSLLCSTVDWI